MSNEPALAKHDAGRVAILDQTLWSRMTDGDDLKAALDAWLAIVCGLVQGVSQGVLVLKNDDVHTGDEVAFTPRSIWPAGTVVNPELARTTELVCARGAGIVRAAQEPSGEASQSSNATRTSLGYPLRIGADVYAAVALILDEGHAADVKQHMRHLQLAAGWFETLIRRKNSRTTADQMRCENMAQTLMQQVLAEPDFYTACVSVMNELAASIRCERASLGFLVNKTSKVFSLSHTVQIDSKLNLFNAIAASMDEAIDQQSTILEPPENDNQSGLVRRAHGLLVSRHHSAQVLTVPFQWRKQNAGAMTFEKSEGAQFSETEITLCEYLAEHLGPLLEERRREERWLSEKCIEKIEVYLSNLFGTGHLSLKLISASCAALLIFLTFAKGEYRVSAPVYLKGEIQRVIAAPFDGYIADANFRAGDLVKKDDVIAHLDDRELLLERLRWQAKKRQHLLEYDQALGDQRRSEMGVIRARVSQAESQMELIDAQLERSRLRAPFDGILVSGDLSQSIGSVVRKGDMLFELVPYEQYRVVLKVDEVDIQYFAVEQSGRLVLTALPDEYFPLTVTKIGSVSASEEGSNYFEVEAQLASIESRAPSAGQLKPGELRPGMEGIAKVDTGKRLLFWIWTHKFFDWLRLQTWSFWP